MPIIYITSIGECIECTLDYQKIQIKGFDI